MKEYDEGYADGFTAGEDERHALRAENARLREALKPFSDMAKYYDANGIPTTRLIANVQMRLLRAARAAMGESDE